MGGKGGVEEGRRRLAVLDGRWGWPVGKHFRIGFGRGRTRATSRRHDDGPASVPTNRGMGVEAAMSQVANWCRDDALVLAESATFSIDSRFVGIAWVEYASVSDLYRCC